MLRLGGLLAWALRLSSGMLIGQTEWSPSRPPTRAEVSAEPDCPFFGPERERFVTEAVRRSPGCRQSAD